MAFLVAMRISLISWLSLCLSSSQQHRTEAVKEEHASRWKSIVTCRELHFGLVLIGPYLKKQQLLERALQPLATMRAVGQLGFVECIPFYVLFHESSRFK
jgi:hypothetical protein